MTLLAIDPGYTHSAWVEYDEGRPQQFGIVSNDELLTILRDPSFDELAIETIASYGMAVGAEVFETCVWSGRLIQRWLDVRPDAGVRRVFRRDVKLHLCGSARAKDANVRQALIDRYGPGKAAAVGLKASPGPLYGISKDVWAALGVAVTASETSVAVREAA